MRAVQRAKAALLAACVVGVVGTTTFCVKGATDPAAQMLSHMLVNDAYSQSRNPAVAADTALQESVILLQLASRLDPDNILTWKLLAQAAAATKQPELRRDALRKIVKLDPGDLVAQVEYLDFLASTKQSIDERAKVYEAALASKALNPQIRSRMAVRLADIAAERGDGSSVRDYLKQALQFDNLNVSALREVVQLSGRSPQTRLSALIMLLTANPFQPDAWLSASRVLSAANLHSQAADLLIVSIEQMQLAGSQIPADLYLELGVELSIAGRFVEAYPIQGNLAQLPDAPLSALVAQRLLIAEYTAPVFVPTTDATTIPDMFSPATTSPATNPAASEPAATSTSPAAATQAATQPADALPDLTLPDITATAPAADTAPATAPVASTAPAPTTQSASDKLNDAIRTQLSASIEKTPDAPAALAQALWIEFSVMPDANPKTADWLKHYAELVPADDATLARLNGWSLLRAGKLDDAKAILEKRAPADPMAQLGLARVLIAQGKLEEGAAQVQDLWSSHPTGLLALEVAQTIRQTKIKITDTALSRQIAGILQQIPPGSLAAHRSPRELELVTAALVKAHVAMGDPVFMNVRISNGSGRALSVGDDGAIKTRVGLLGRSRGMGAQNLGLFNVVDLQRVYRLEANDEMNSTVRVDCGILSDLYQSIPFKECTVALKILTMPRGEAESPAAGLGGQEIVVDDIDRDAAKDSTIENALAAFANDKQLTYMPAVGLILAQIPEETGVPSADPKRMQAADSRAKIIGALLPASNSTSPVTRAILLRSVPLVGLGDKLEIAVEKMMQDPDALVRMMWAWKLMNGGVRSVDLRQTMVDNLKKMSDAEQDPLAKKWMEILTKDMNDQIAAAAAVPTAPPPQVDTIGKPATTAPERLQSIPDTSLIPSHDQNP